MCGKEDVRWQCDVSIIEINIVYNAVVTYRL